MPVPKTDLEVRLYVALKRITAYQTPDRMRRWSNRDWCLDYEEALTMAYENIQSEAKQALEGVRAPLPRVKADDSGRAG